MFLKAVRNFIQQNFRCCEVVYPWYLQLHPPSDKLLQGDLVKACPIVLPTAELHRDQENEFTIKEFDVVVMSQSCDLENDNLEYVLACPFYSFATYISYISPEHRKKPGQIENHFKHLEQGIQPNYHLLDKHQEFGLIDYQVVDFRNVFSIHLELLKKHVVNQDNRLRILPPYREHLAQAFARFFMRVGLPQNIRLENPNGYVKQ